MSKTVLRPEEQIFRKIYVVRDQKILLDADLAELYGVPTKALKQAVKRNADRFPDDFMFELSAEEWNSLRSQFVTLNDYEFGNEHSQSKRGKHSKYLPMAFTEQGVAMLSSVLKSKRAVDVNIQIMRVFVKMRQMINSYHDLVTKIEKLEASDLQQNEDIRNIYDVIKELLEPAVKHQRPIGFRTSRDKE